MSDSFYVYLWTNKVNGKRYVGKGHGTRSHDHVGESRKEQPGSLIAKAMKKHGIENFEFEFLVEDIPEDHAVAWEKGYIDHFRTNKCRGGHGYNMTDGGDGISGYRHSEETRRKLSEAQHGKTHSEKTRRKLSEVLRGKKRSEETRRKMSEAFRGRKHSEESRRKIGEAKCGENNPSSHANRARRVFAEIFAHPRSKEFIGDLVRRTTGLDRSE